MWNDWLVHFGEESYQTLVQALQGQEPRLKETIHFRNQALKYVGRIEKQWEAYEELQKGEETLPKLGVLGLDGSWVKREEAEEFEQIVETEETEETYETEETPSTT